MPSSSIRLAEDGHDDALGRVRFGGEQPIAIGGQGAAAFDGDRRDEGAGGAAGLRGGDGLGGLAAARQGDHMRRLPAPASSSAGWLTHSPPGTADSGPAGGVGERREREGEVVGRAAADEDRDIGVALGGGTGCDGRAPVGKLLENGLLGQHP